MLYFDEVKGWEGAGVVNYKCTIVWIDDANKIEGESFLARFLPDAALLLNHANSNQRELPAMRL